MDIFNNISDKYLKTLYTNYSAFKNDPANKEKLTRFYKEAKQRYRADPNNENIAFLKVMEYRQMNPTQNKDFISSF